MAHASLRWGDTLAIANLKLAEGVVIGIIKQSKTSEAPTEFCCPERGFKNLQWSHALFIYREKFRKKRRFARD